MKFKMLMMFILTCLFSVLAFAQDAPVDPSQPPAWLSGVMMFMQSMPYVGPVLVEVLKWVGLVSAIMTALSTAASAILVVLKGFSVWAGWAKVEAALSWVQEKVMPWLKHLSMYNVQKK